MRRILLGILALAAAAPAADFSFNVLIRAGVSGAGDWEVGMGLNSSGVPAVSGQVGYYNNATPQRFEIGYNAATQQAFTRIYSDAAGSSLRLNLTYNVPSGTALSPTATWTLPASQFYVSASGRPLPTSVNVSSLALGVLNPLSLTASNPGGVTTSQLSTQGSNIVFQGASWMLSGQLTMSGLAAYAGSGGANRSQLQFGLNAQVTETPEPGTFALLLAGCAGLVWHGRRTRRAVPL